MSSLATFLSFLWPGLGQLLTGERRRAALFGVPPLVLLLGGGAWLVTNGAVQAAGWLLSPTGSLVAAAVLILLAAWRLIAMADAVRGPRSAMAFGFLAVGVVVTHGYPAIVAAGLHNAGTRAFIARPAGGQEQADPLAASRFTILLAGADGRPWRDWNNTDTLLVVSIARDGGRSVMVSVPRDIARLTLSDGRRYDGKINTLLTYASQHPAEFPEGGEQTLRREIGHLLGVPVDYFAMVDLEGLRRLVDAVGGIEVLNPSSIDDPLYKFEPEDPGGFALAPGAHHLDGWSAIAYVRSRYGTGDLDRARRQQDLLLGLRRALLRPEALLRLPEVLDAAGGTLRADLPPDRLGDVMELLGSVDLGTLDRRVLGSPVLVHPPVTVGDMEWRWEVVPEEMARFSVELFGEDSRYAQDVTAGP